jgi:hypothetical protein
VNLNRKKTLSVVLFIVAIGVFVFAVLQANSYSPPVSAPMTVAAVERTVQRAVPKKTVSSKPLTASPKSFVAKPPSSAPPKLSNTGPGDVALLYVLSVIVGTTAYQWYLRSRCS